MRLGPSEHRLVLVQSLLLALMGSADIADPVTELARFGAMAVVMDRPSGNTVFRRVGMAATECGAVHQFSDSLMRSCCKRIVAPSKQEKDGTFDHAAPEWPSR